MFYRDSLNPKMSNRDRVCQLRGFAICFQSMHVKVEEFYAGFPRSRGQEQTWFGAILASISLQLASQGFPGKKWHKAQTKEFPLKMTEKLTTESGPFLRVPLLYCFSVFNIWANCSVATYPCFLVTMNSRAENEVQSAD